MSHEVGGGTGADAVAGSDATPQSAATPGGTGDVSAASTPVPSNSVGLMNLIHERQSAGNAQILDLSHANLDTFPSEIEFLREVLEK